jgi:hypothetical protein
MERRTSSFNAAPGRATSGSLVFLSGGTGIALLADPRIPDLAVGRFAGPGTHVEAGDGTVVVHSHRLPRSDERHFRRGGLAEIRLNATIPWEIEFRGPVAGLEADLRGLQLRSLDVLGSASEVRLRLSRPPGAGFIYISGDARQVSILRPAGTGIRISAIGGISGLTFDGRYHARVVGEAQLESAGWQESLGGYQIGIAGSASELTVDREGEG